MSPEKGKQGHGEEKGKGRSLIEGIKKGGKSVKNDHPLESQRASTCDAPKNQGSEALYLSKGMRQLGYGHNAYPHLQLGVILDQPLEPETT